MSVLADSFNYSNDIVKVIPCASQNNANLKKMIIKYYIFIFLLLCSGQASACNLLLHTGSESVKDQRSQYFIDVLRLALDKTPDLGECFTLKALQSPMYQARALKSLDKDYGVDIVWSMTSKERETKFLPIRIPLLKGLLGFRTFIIRRIDEEKFANIQSLKELQSLVIGQGRNWPDTKILRANNFSVVEGGSYDGLFKMLQLKRFDYFPRGVTEIWEELLAHQGKDLIMEQTLLLHYNAPIYFFVSKKNTALAERIERGLILAIKDGTFDTLFMNNSVYKKYFGQLRIESRRTIELNNPFLTAETPLGNINLWYKPGQARVSNDEAEPKR